MTWRDPPLLRAARPVRELNGRKLLLFYDGCRLRQIAWTDPAALYYVTNTLNRRLSNRADARDRAVIDGD